MGSKPREKKPDAECDNLLVSIPVRIEYIKVCNKPRRWRAISEEFGAEGTGEFKKDAKQALLLVLGKMLCTDVNSKRTEEFDGDTKITCCFGDD